MTFRVGDRVRIIKDSLRHRGSPDRVGKYGTLKTDVYPDGSCGIRVDGHPYSTLLEFSIFWVKDIESEIQEKPYDPTQMGDTDDDI